MEANTHYPVILNGDHAEFEAEWVGNDPKTRPDWPMPSFNAMDWAEAFCKVANAHRFHNAKGDEVDAGWMVSWFAGALMRGYDQRQSEIPVRYNADGCRLDGKGQA